MAFKLAIAPIEVVDTPVHVFPFHASTSVRRLWLASCLLPTAKHRVVEGHETSDSI
jgi:hypothetical protein